MEVDAMSENSAATETSKGGKAKASKPVLGSHNAGAGGKTIEETYQKLSQLEHILLRSDTYIGSTEKQQQLLWVHDSEKMTLRNVTYAPGLYKIFDEILVNAADNKVRDPTMDTLRVDIDVEKGEVRVLNNGAGVPVEMHKTEGMYVPELIFGHLLTSSNYNDNEKKVTGGRNGYGAKLANIFSKKFTVETCDGKRQRRYKQVFQQNMTQKSEPAITACKPTDNWTTISFQPDLARFGMEELEEDTVALMRKRVYDMAGILGKTVKVYFNGERLPIKDFQSYVDLYIGPRTAEGAAARVYERYSDRWEVCVAISDGQFNQVSFVNSICTSKGGTHVNHIADQVVKHVVESMAKKHKQAGVKPFMVKNYLWVFVNCLVENPAFDSQTKDTLTLRASAFGSKCDLSEAFLKKVAAAGVTDAVLSFASFKANRELKKGDGAKRTRLTGIPKLDDANDAGGRNSETCTLILTEGDSAKSLAVSGLSVVGRDRYGVFPLRGKLLNVREAGAAQVTANAEIAAIKQILGLQHGKVYADAKSLRYGHLMIMTDQDHDGSHIKGLIMNFLHHFYPSLLHLPGFLVEFITPIIKATKGRDSVSFFTLPEYEAWREGLANPRGWRVKYYKGLGTSTSAEAKEYFANIESHRKVFVWEGEEDGEAIDMAFSKKKVEERKQWLRAYEPGTFLDHSADTISYHEFVHKELILFSRADLERSIPCMVDGLKPGQRKILYACFKRNLRSDIKVAQLAGYVAEHSAYHHGEASLMSTILGLAQDFVGSNNLNMLVPQGQFGTRLQGGKDAASPRYIFTRLAPLTRHLFNEADDRLLDYLNEEGQSIEPSWYMPILPAVLVNGAEGIGTGWSTSIPNYNPRDVVDNLKRMLDGEAPAPMAPWYRGFKGAITEAPSKSGRSYAVAGVITQLDDATLEISELPVRRWTQDYKEFLEEMMKPGDKGAPPFITDYKEHHTDASVRFVVTLPEAHMREALAAGLHAKFKLTTKISIGNMVLFDANGTIKKYDGPEQILEEFFHLRLAYYARRKDALLNIAEAELLRISNKVRFILAVVGGTLKLSNRRRADIEADLEAQGFDRLCSQKRAAVAAAAAPPEESTDEEEPAVDEGSFDYLLGMALSSLTLEKVQALQSEAAEKDAEVCRLRGTTEAEMWRADLDAFLEGYTELEAADTRRECHLARQQARARKGQAAQGRAAKARAAGKSKKASQWSDDDDEPEVESDSEPGHSEDDFVAAKKPAKKPAPPRPRAAPAASQAAAAPPAAKKPAAPPRPKPAPKPAAPPPPPLEEEMSLMQRMAQRMGGMALGSTSGGRSSSACTGPAAPARPAASGAARPGRAAAAAAKKKTKAAVAVDSEAEEESADESGSEEDFVLGSDDDDEVNSPAVVAARPRAAPAARGPSNLGGKRPATTAAPPAAARPVDVDLAGVDDSPSPALSKPVTKVQRIRPSPFHKGSGLAARKPAPRPKAAAAPKAAAKAAPKPAAAQKKKGKKAADSEDGSEFELSDVEEAMDESPGAGAAAAAKPRAVPPRRAAAAPAKPAYVESESDEEESEPDSEDYAPSD